MVMALKNSDPILRILISFAEMEKAEKVVDDVVAKTVVKPIQNRKPFACISQSSLYFSSQYITVPSSNNSLQISSPTLTWLIYYSLSPSL